MAKLGVVMVAHRSAAVIGGCLRSVAADLATISETDQEAQATVVVVDNASTDDSVAVARAALPDVVVHQTGANLGYAAGLNAGFACLPDADKVLVLNPDVRLLPGALAAMLAAFSDPGIGIVVPRIVDEGGAVQWSMRRRPTVLRAFGEAVLGGRRAGRMRPLGEMVVDEDAYAAPACPDWATGAAMLLSRRCIDTIGLWDESFFMYSEETEYALRAANAGFILKYTPYATVVHLGGEAMTSPVLYPILTKNRLALYRRNHGRVARGAFRSALVLNEALRAPRAATHRAALRTLLTDV